ncbi:MAG: hypothetical protein MZV70_22245 [Desulfobacterales bacterium]|nr:hypothetical protein [Desulfobacterales bacterium]
MMHGAVGRDRSSANFHQEEGVPMLKEELIKKSPVRVLETWHRGRTARLATSA